MGATRRQRLRRTEDRAEEETGAIDFEDKQEVKCWAV